MTQSPRMGWPIPTENQDPWYEAFKEMVTALDASGYASREDRQLILAGGGTISWSAVTSILDWTGTLKVVSPLTGFLLQVGPTTVTISDGEVLYATLVRAPSLTQTIVVAVGSQVPSSDLSFALAVRVGSKLYWRNGTTMSTGDSFDDVGSGGGGASAGAGSYKDMATTYLYTNALVSVEEVVGQGSFDGSLVGAGGCYFFGMQTPTLSVPGWSELRLYDVGPAAGPPAALTLIASLQVTTSGGPKYLEQALSIGPVPAPSQIAGAARMYEVRAMMSASPGDTVFIGGSGISVR